MILDCFSLSVCSQICTSYNDCKSAVYDDNSNNCYLYNFTEKVTTGSASGKTYIVRDDCSSVESIYQVNVNWHTFFFSTNMKRKPFLLAFRIPYNTAVDSIVLWTHVCRIAMGCLFSASFKSYPTCAIHSGATLYYLVLYYTILPAIKWSQVKKKVLPS